MSNLHLSAFFNSLLFCGCIVSMLLLLPWVNCIEPVLSRRVSLWGQKCVNKKPSCHSVARLNSQRSREAPYFLISFVLVQRDSLKKPNRDERSEINIKTKKLCPSPNCLKTTLTAVWWFLLPWGIFMLYLLWWCYLAPSWTPFIFLDWNGL